MAARILINSVEVRNRLDEMGVTYDELVEVVDAMVGERALCTDNDPPGARGWASWRMGIRRLREILRRKDGWVKDENRPSPIGAERTPRHPDRRLATRMRIRGIDDPNLCPCNRAEKGLATDRIVQQNQQSFMATLDESVNVVQFPDVAASKQVITWYLCLYNEGDIVRAELSCPDGLENGFFTGFIERIILIGSEEPDDGTPRRYGNSDGEDGLDVPVKRKTRET